MPDINITLDNSDKVVNVTLEQEEPVIEVEVVSSGPAGAPGYTPVKGVDYFDGYTPVKGVDYFDGQDGYTPIKGVDYFDGYTPVKGVDYFDGYTPVKGVDYFDGQDGKDGEDGAPGAPGKDGADGYTPVKGVDYFDGADGVSPEVSVTDITGGHRVTITDEDHPLGQTFDIMDGDEGPTGPAGPGVPNGGSAGQMLVKNSATDQDTKWSSDAYRTASIPYGALDGTSTATVMTATVPGITELRDGVCMLLKNGVVTSASGVTLNINNLGAKPIYYNMAAATALTTVFNVNYTLLFVYDEDRVAGGCWVAYYGYYASGSNNIGYMLRTNKTSLPMSDKVYRYRLLFTSPDGTKFVPANASTSTAADTSKTPITRPIDPFGRIVYYSTTTAVSAGSRPGATYIWDQYEVALGYSFNNTGAALTLTSWNPVYLKCAPQADGSAIIDATTPYVQSLPSTADGKIYIFLGIAYDATHIELFVNHPVYYYDGGIRLWTNAKTPPVTSVNGQTGDVSLALSPSVNTSYISVTEPVVTLDPCPVTYDFGECDELTVTVTATTQYHFSFVCPSATPTVLTMTGITGTSGDTLEAGKRYEVDIWNGVALIKNIEVTAV